MTIEALRRIATISVDDALAIAEGMLPCDHKKAVANERAAKRRHGFIYSPDCSIAMIVNVSGAAKPMRIF